MERTIIIYYIEEQDTPYLVKLNIAPHMLTLKDFKKYALKRQKYILNMKYPNYFFKSTDDDIG